MWRQNGKEAPMPMDDLIAEEKCYDRKKAMLEVEVITSVKGSLLQPAGRNRKWGTNCKRQRQMFPLGEGIFSVGW